MAQAVGGRWKLKLCLNDEQGLAWWKVEGFPNGGHLYLHRGWKHFTHALDLQDMFSLVLRYDGRSQININVFDLTTSSNTRMTSRLVIVSSPYTSWSQGVLQ